MDTIEYDGGKGAVQLKPLTVLGIYRAAINNGYNLTHEQRRAIVREAFCVLESPDSEARERLSAAKVLLAADKLDLEAEKLQRGVAASTVNNTQVNINGVDASATIQELAKLTPDQIRALRARPVEHS